MRGSVSKFPKSKYFLSKDEKELTSKNLQKKTQELENLQKFNSISPALSMNNNDGPIQNENANISFSTLTPFIKSSENINVPNQNNNNNNNNNESHRGSINSNNSNNSRMSNCGRQLY